MYLDFDNLKTIAAKLHEEYEADMPASRGDRHVYTIEFHPAEPDSLRVHVEWGLFKALVEDNLSTIVDMSSVPPKAIHLSARVRGITLIAVLFDFQVKDLFDKADYPVNFTGDTLELFKLWQNLTGWGLNMMTKEALYE